MKKFLEYCYEANANGSKFEEEVAKNVKKWLKLNNLTSQFSAKRYQKMTEDNGHRDEDFSDIIVHDKKNKTNFFIECKSNSRDNGLNVQFDIDENCHLIPVKKIQREESKSKNLKKLSKDIENTEEWKVFSKFMLSKQNGIMPIDVWLQKIDITDQQLQTAIKQYNSLVSSKKTSSNNKKFNPKVIREKTRHQLYVALLWRLSGHSTWDIVHLKNISYFGQMVKDHYMYNKAGDVKYIQIQNNCFRFNDDPLNTTCIKFPENIEGQFDLKFTPRFGKGALYMTPRSKMTSKIKSNFTFKK